MSRSNNNAPLNNPATMFIDWDSEKGCFKTYDKVAKVNKEIKLPVRFYVLDELTTVKGFSDKTQGGIWSNEVKDITKQPLKVMSKGKDQKLVTLSEGLYTNIKNDLVANGGKYTRSLYAAMLDENDDYQIVNFQLKGAAFSGWLDFVNEHRNSILADEIICNDFKKEKKGATKYTIPVFSSEPASEEGNEAAIKLDVELQEYMKEYFNRSQASEYVTDTEGTVQTDGYTQADKLPFD